MAGNLVVADKPIFPLIVHFHETGEKWVLDSMDDAACNLEWFDSEDPAERATVTDVLGRPVRLTVEQLLVQICEIK